MGDKIVMLPLPGISNRDPDFYAGPDTTDRARFAQPVETGVVTTMPERQVGTGARVAADSDAVPPIPQGGNAVPFKLAPQRGRR